MRPFGRPGTHRHHKGPYPFHRQLSVLQPEILALPNELKTSQPDRSELTSAEGCEAFFIECNRVIPISRHSPHHEHALYLHLMAGSAHPAKLAKDWEDFSTSWFRVGNRTHRTMKWKVTVRDSHRDLRPQTPDAPIWKAQHTPPPRGPHGPISFAD